jgi:hypothetical protein
MNKNLTYPFTNRPKWSSYNYSEETQSSSKASGARRPFASSFQMTTALMKKSV